MPTTRQMTALRMMRDLDEEMVVDGLAVYVGDEAFSQSTTVALLSYLAIKDVSDIEGKGLRRYVINEVGEAILRRPMLAHEVRNHVFTDQRPFTVRNDKIELLTPATPDKQP